jgi:hypothetical protein
MQLHFRFEASPVPKQTDQVFSARKPAAMKRAMRFFTAGKSSE